MAMMEGSAMAMMVSARIDVPPQSPGTTARTHPRRASPLRRPPPPPPLRGLALRARTTAPVRLRWSSGCLRCPRPAATPPQAGGSGIPRESLRYLLPLGPRAGRLPVPLVH
eukprot:10580316-Alexandrium_andersonii.AAC.1